MADSLSLKVILSALDRGFSSAMKSAIGATESLQNKISGFKFGLLAGAGQAAFSMMTSGVRDLISEIDSANIAWKNFEGNMAIFGKSSGEIKKVKKELQSFAEQTIYDSSEMASTYAQLEAVGTKNTLALVKGFGGLAAAAENPQQAMKTLSTQATQMAARPTVAWMDFKLMLDQTPAGIAAIAKEMNMTAPELVAAIQAGEVATEDFFDAIVKVGNSDAFADLATEYKSVGQAMSGLKETLANKLGPAFDLLSQHAITNINGIIDAISSIDAEALQRDFSRVIEGLLPYWEAFKDAIVTVGSVAKDVFDGIVNFLTEHSETLSKLIKPLVLIGAALLAFKVINSVVPGFSLFVSGITKLAGKGIETIAAKLFGVAAGEEAAGTAAETSSSNVLQAAGAFLMMAGAVLLISAGFALLAYSAIEVASAGPAAIAVMFGMIAAVAALGIGMMVMLKSLSAVGPEVLPAAGAMLMLAGAVILIAVGFALLAQTAIAISSAGTGAVVVLLLMVVAIAALMAVAAALGPVLTAAAVGLLAFGVAMLLVGAGALLASIGLAIIAEQLPLLCEYGAQGAGIITLLGLALIVFAAGALLAGAAALVLGAGLLVAGAGLLVAGVAALVCAVGIMVLAVSAQLLASAFMVLMIPMMLIMVMFPLMAVGALLLMASFLALTAIAFVLMAALLVLVVPLTLVMAMALVAAVGITAFGVAMMVAFVGTLLMAVALAAVNSSMKQIASNAQAAESSLNNMKDSVSLVESGLAALGDKADAAMDGIKSVFTSTANESRPAGQKVGQNFAEGLTSALNQAASQTQATVMRIVTTLASGETGARSAGMMISSGFANGMLAYLGQIESAAQKMVEAADKAVQAKARISSPAKLFAGEGRWTALGYAGGILDNLRAVWNAAEEMVRVPQIASNDFAIGYSGAVSGDYDYYRSSEYVIEVPLSVDGKAFAKATARHMQNELNTEDKRNSRKYGRV